jgi:putative addiction module component (TIGR02574 family)
LDKPGTKDTPGARLAASFSSCYDSRKEITVIEATGGESLMQISMKSLGIDQLPVGDRLSLLEEIWDSIAAEPEAIPLTEAQKQDLQARVDANKANPKAGSPWEEVKAQLQRKS